MSCPNVGAPLARRQSRQRFAGRLVTGKTGAAELLIDRNSDSIADRDGDGNLPTHAWFTAFAPYEDPEIALIASVFGGGEGATTAVPIANDILN